MQKIILGILVLVSMFFSVSITEVSAQGLKDAGTILRNIGGDNGEKLGVSGDLATSIATIIKTVLALVGTIFLVLTIYAGIMWMTAAGNSETTDKALNMIRAAVIGLVIVMSAYAVTYFITSKLGVGQTASTSSSGPAPVDPYQVGCCFNQSSGVKTDSIASDCTGFQETWTAGSCNP